MALEYRRIPREAGPPVDTVTIDRHLYLTEDKTRVVPEGHPKCRWLWATPGMDVPRADAERLGAIALPEPAEDAPEDSGDGPAPGAAVEEPVVEQEPAEEKPKAAAKPADKQRSKPGDKSRDGSVAELRRQATEAGVQVDNRWGADRIRREIAATEASRKD